MARQSDFEAPESDRAARKRKNQEFAEDVLSAIRNHADYDPRDYDPRALHLASAILFLRARVDDYIARDMRSRDGFAATGCREALFLLHELRSGAPRLLADFVDGTGQ